MTEERDVDHKRRGFLKLATLAPAAAVASGAGGAAAAEEAAAGGAGLRKTEHVRKYLETARY